MRREGSGRVRLRPAAVRSRRRGPAPSRTSPSRGWWWLARGRRRARARRSCSSPSRGRVETEPIADRRDLADADRAPEPSPTPSVSVAPPGSDARVRRDDEPGLFVTAADLVADVPAAKPGVDELGVVRPGALGAARGHGRRARHLRAGGDRRRRQPPSFYDVRRWGNDAMDFEQEVDRAARPGSRAGGVPRAGHDHRRVPDLPRGERRGRGRAVDRASRPSRGRASTRRSCSQSRPDGPRGTTVPGYRGRCSSGTRSSRGRRRPSRRGPRTPRSRPWATPSRCRRWCRGAPSWRFARSGDAPGA